MTRIRLPFIFSVQVRSSRALKARRRDVLAFCDVEIEEIKNCEMAIAATWKTYIRTGALTSSKVVGKIDNILYRPLGSLTNRWFPSASETGLYEFQDVAEKNKALAYFATMLPREPFRTTGVGHHLWSNKDGAFADLRGTFASPILNVVDDQDERADTAASLYSYNLLVVDGELWTTVDAEPFWRVADPGDRLHLSLETSLVGRTVIPFRVDDRSGAMDYIASKAAGRPLVERNQELCVHYPEVFRHGLDLLCDNMLDAFRDYEAFRRHYNANDDPWHRCSSPVRQLGGMLLTLSRKSISGVDQSRRALDAALELDEHLSHETRIDQYLRIRLRRALGRSLRRWLEIKQDNLLIV